MQLNHQSIFFVGLSLFFVVITVATGVVALTGLHSAGGVAEAVAFFSPMILLPLVCMFFAWRGLQCSQRFMSLFVCAASILCVFGNYYRISLLPPVAVGILWFAAMLLLPSVPAGRRGFFLGMAMAAGEMVWLILFLLIRTAFLQPTGASVLEQLSTLQAAIQLCCGLCLAASLALTPPPLTHLPLNTLSGKNGVAAPVGKGPYVLLGLLFATGMAFFVLFGLGKDLGFPRLGMFKMGFSNFDYILLFGAPVAGILIDSGAEKPEKYRRSLDLLFIFLFVVALAASALTVFGAAGSMGAGGLVRNLFFLGRQIIFVSLLVLGCRLLWRTVAFPLFGGMVYSLYFLSHAGSVLGRRLADAPDIRAGLFFALCAALGLCLFLFRKRVSASPGLLHEPGVKATEDEAALPAEEAAQNKQQAFVAAFGLSAREAEVLDAILRGLEMDAIGRELGVTERTARFHLTGLLKKALL